LILPPDQIVVGCERAAVENDNNVPRKNLVPCVICAAIAFAEMRSIAGTLNAPLRVQELSYRSAVIRLVQAGAALSISPQ
jgi:hypothetical protein